MTLVTKEKLRYRDLLAEGEQAYQQAISFKKHELLAYRHLCNRQNAYYFLDALQTSTTAVLEHFLDKNIEIALEVGCGDNFFKNLLAPEWLKPKLVGFDIHFPSLTIAQHHAKRSTDASLFQADVNELCIAEESVDAIFGVSAFDSFFALEHALKQAIFPLKKGSPLILLQYCLPDPYAEKGKMATEKTTLFYHQQLVSTVKSMDNLKILAGDETMVEWACITPLSKIKALSQEPILPEPPPLIFTLNYGEGRFIGRPEDPNDIRFVIDEFNQTFQTNLNSDEDFYSIKSNEVIQWVRFPHLIAEKI